MCININSLIKSLLTLLLSLGILLNTLVAQSRLRGEIIDFENNEKLLFANLYLNNTTIGTTSDQNGEFSLMIPEGEYEVIVQYTGYQTISFNIDSKNLAPKYRVQLVPESVKLASVDIKGERDQVWYQNLEVFKTYFLGQSINANKCQILNEKVLIIYHDQENSILRVRAREPLEIMNTNLGYLIKYELVDFEYDLKNGIVFSAGYPFFQELELSNTRKRKVEKNRMTAYQGSSVHFLKKLIDDQLMESGYKINRVNRVKNPNRPSDEEISNARSAYLKTKDVKVKDSLMNNIISKSRLAPFEDHLDTRPLLPSTILSEEGDHYQLQADFLIQVIYLNEKEEINYPRKNQTTTRSPQTSLIHLINGSAKLDFNGNIMNPKEVLFEGYMGWEKVGDMMPLDYKLQQKK